MGQSSGEHTESLRLGKRIHYCCFDGRGRLGAGGYPAHCVWRGHILGYGFSIFESVSQGIRSRFLNALLAETVGLAQWPQWSLLMRVHQARIYGALIK